MAEKDAFDDRRKAHEEDYFRRKDQELIERMRQQAAAERDRKSISDASGVTDAAVLDELIDIGYTADTVGLLKVVPLVQIAWAEGTVSDDERDLIVKTAAAEGITPGTPAYDKLQSWLTTRPADRIFTVSLRAIRSMLERLDPAARDAASKSIVDLCTTVASASREFLGLGRKINAEERTLLERIAAGLTPEQQKVARSLVEPE